MNLRIPGPTPLPEAVLQATGQQMINHRGPEFVSLLKKITARLKAFFQTEGEVFILTASGTGGLEAALVNLLSPGDRVLAVSVGYFGDRFARIAEVFGAQLTKLDFPWGEAANPEIIRERLIAKPGFKLVLVTHNETSTGVTNDLAAIAEAVKISTSLRREHSVERSVESSLGDRGPLLAVDAISSLGAIDLPMDEWGCDVVITGSQKAWMAPPGLAMVGVSRRAWPVVERAESPRFYWDFRSLKTYAERGQTPFTPALSALYGLGCSLELMAEEGLSNIFARHRRLGRYTREGIKALGLGLLADEAHASDTVTAVRIPSGVDGSALLARLREEYGVILGGGQGPLRGKIFRIGHMGYVSEADIDRVLEALKSLIV